MEQPAHFPTTAWTQVLSAGRRSDTQGTGALASLCERYWQPIYAYVRRRGFSSDEAQDLTQEFFARVLEKNYIERADRSKGRFRSFLLSSLQYFLCDEGDRQRALKRGGGQASLPFEVHDGEECYRQEPRHDETPERIFERRWALALLDRVLLRLREDCIRHGRGEHFDRLKGFLLERGDAPYAAVAADLGMSEGALKVAIHRMRKKYRDFFRDEIADTVDSPDEVQGEIQYLLNALNRE
jgi:RNA polymerase sigma factor (sigma-70 family)